MYLWQEPLIEIFFGHSEADEQNIHVMSPYKTEQELIYTLRAIRHRPRLKVECWSVLNHADGKSGEYS